MKVHAKLIHNDASQPYATTFEYPGPDLPRILHFGGLVFEVMRFASIPLPGKPSDPVEFRIEADYLQLDVFSAELSREVHALADEEEIAAMQERALDQAVKQHAPLFAEALARYIGGAEDQALEYRAIAERAFNAYNEHGPTPWLTFDGRPVPRWDAITEAVREKWIAAVKACVSAEVHRRRSAVTALEDLQKAFEREASTDGPVFNRGRSEGRADVAALLRMALPGAAEKLTIDAQVKLVADFKMRVAELVDWARTTLTQPPSPKKDSAFVAGVNVDRLAELLRRSE
jgi:hypothetical protein